MNSSPRQEKVSEMMERAEAALRRAQWFEAERLALKSLEIARREDDFDSMARIVMPLQEARRQRLQLALEHKKIHVLEGDISDEMALSPGCYVVQPPAVGADARRLRLAALRREVPVAVLCREPRTRTGLCPIVTIGQQTVRVRIDPPKNWDKPDFKWFVAALESLGNGAIDALDTGLELDRQIDFLLSVLDGVPEHEKLHQLLESKCKDAVRGFIRSAAVDVLDEELAGVEEEEEIDEDGTVLRRKEAKIEEEDED
ncbi:MAG: hypothetical protein JNK53_03675 [Phycisphaerae bacterium]|nr:hypothetical protein [Phycisphaerae bacterium]